MSLEIKIEKMTCQHCVKAVTKALENVSGVEKVEVNLENKNAVITGSANKETLIKAVIEAGYKAQ